MRAFTVTTLSFVLMVLNSSFTVVAFSGVLWSMSPLLFIVAVLYAACGSSLTIALGRPLHHAELQSTRQGGELPLQPYSCAGKRRIHYDWRAVRSD